MPALPQPYSNQTVAEWIAELQQSESPENRLRALQAIGLRGSNSEIAPWATHSLRDADSTVRAFAAKLLGTNEIPLTMETESMLGELLNDIDPDTQFESARALIRRHSSQSKRCVPVLLGFLDEEETQPLMIASVVNILVEAPPIDGLTESVLLPRIERFLDHDRAEVREAIAIALAKWPRLCEPLGQRLVPLLDDSEPVVRENIAMALGKSGVNNEEIRSALQIATQDEDTEVARVATEALQKLNG